MPVLFLVTFVNLLGFGLIIPLLPFYVERAGAGPEVITLVIALFSLLQFVAGPVIGRLSDRFGRRPVLAWTTAGAVLSHVLLGFADSLWSVIVARSIGGMMAGSVGVIYAYVADVSSGPNRARSMGILSAAFSLGFMLGPGLGGLLAGSELQTANFALPAFSAAGLSAVACAAILIFLPESLKPEHRAVSADATQVPLGARLRVTFSKGTLTELVLLAFLFYVAWSAVLSIFALWMNRVLALGPTNIGVIFMYSGFIGVVCQLALIGPLSNRFGDNTIVVLTVIISGLGLLMLSAATTVTVTILAMTLLSASHSLFTPVGASLVSKEAAPNVRGVVLGVYQSIGSLGRVVGPTFSGTAFAQLGSGAPYLIGAILMAPCLFLALMITRRAGVTEASEGTQ